MLRIFATFEDGTTADYELDKTSVLIGRAPGVDLQFDVPGVSRYHARVFLENGALFVQDLESRNGTFVGQSRIAEATSLEGGDLIFIGTLRLAVTVKDPNTDTIAQEIPAALSGVGPVTASIPPATPAASSVSLPGASAAVSPGVVEDAADPREKDFYWESLRSFLQPIWPYLNDDSVSEIMLNGPDEIYIERKGQLSSIPVTFTKHQLDAAVLNIAQYVGRRVDEQEPYLDARLPDGSRVAVLLPPCSKKGVAVAIRKFAKEKLTVDRLVEFGSISNDMLTFLRACVVLKKNIVISGGTSSGKTSLLNVVSGLIPQDERIITIEDSAELQLHQDHVLPMESKPPDKKGRGQMTIRDLVRASLRMRPDRIIVGEIRGGEALDLLQAMNTGHSGSMATVHASSPIQALSRLETLALFSGLEIPIRALREQVSSALDIVIQASRLPDHSRKVTHISEVGGLKEDGTYSVQHIFQFQHAKTENGKIVGTHVKTDAIPTLLDELKVAGLSEAVRLFEQ